MKTIGLALLCAYGGFAAKQVASIPAGSKVFIESNVDIETYMRAAFGAKRVPLEIVMSAGEADYVLNCQLGTSDQEGRRDILTGARASYVMTEAAFKLTNKANVIIWVYAVTKGFSRGTQSISESCAKHLKMIVEKRK